ncbi:MAG: hypothetical protein MO853_01255 [Candidatus Protistobacter heckmanni]|nr:hypothetical protein [Candidatus Protistobacter heckmanni]
MDVTDAANRNISAWILDATNYQAMHAGQNFQGVGRAKATTPTELPFNVKDAGSYYLLLDNRYALVGSKNVRIQMQTFRRLDPGKGNALYSRLLNGYQMLRLQFDFPDFDIEVKPCRMVNALSARTNGDITLCSEMLDASEDKPWLFTGILLHEIGHSLLNL